MFRYIHKKFRQQPLDGNSPRLLLDINPTILLFLTQSIHNPAWRLPRELIENLYTLDFG